MKRMKTQVILAVGVMVVVGAAVQGQESWPQFRGPGSNGISSEAGLPSEWGTDKNVAWKAPLQGEGWASPVIWEDKVFVAVAVPDPADVARAAQEQPEGADSQDRPQRPRGQGGGAAGQDRPRRPGGEGAAEGQDRPRRPREGNAAGQDRPQRPREGQAGEGRGARQGRGGPGGRGGSARIPDIKYSWELRCLDRNTGKELWKATPFAGKPKISRQRANTYASETPVTDGKHIWAYFGMTGVCCYDVSGKEVWKKELGVFPMQNGWGTASSPALYGGMLYLQVDNEEKSFVVALDAMTGDEKWRADRDEKSTWSSPIVWTNSKRTELVTSGKTVRSYDPKSGTLLWQLGLGGGDSSATPVTDGDRLYVGAPTPRRRGRGGDDSNAASGIAGLYAVKAGASGDISLQDGQTGNAGVAWVRPGVGPERASPLVYQGRIYLIKQRNGIVSCYKATTGEPLYEDQEIPGARDFWASPWAYDGKVFCLDGEGTTHVLAADDAFKVLGTNKVSEQCWASTAVAGKTLLLRSVDNLYAIRQ